MARYEYPFTIIHRCGHPGKYKATDDLILSYKARLSERDCNECRDIKGGREVLLVDGNEFIVPAITIGTDKQIAWAVKIRRNVINALLQRHHSGDTNPLDWMKSRSTASWWIEKRNEPPTEFASIFPKAA